MTTFALDNIEQQQDTTRLRALITWVRDTVLGCGWVQTTDTGQLDPATPTYPGSNGVIVGYLMFRMNDSLQATFPVFMKLSFGSGATIPGPQVVVNIGSTTNGAGVITNNTLAASISMNSAPSGANKIHRASGDVNRFVCALWAQQVGVSSVAACWFWSVERTHNPDGSDNGDGVMFVAKHTYTTFAACRHGILLPPGVAQAPTTMSQYAIGQIDSLVLSTTVRGTTAGAFPVYPAGVRPTLASLNVLSCIEGDFATLVPLPVTHFGAARTYLPLGRWNVNTMGRYSTGDDAVSAMMRWE